MSRKYIAKNVRDEVRNRFGGRCGYCGEPSDKLHIDHVLPVARAHMHRGFNVDAIENLMPSCASCNNYKMSFDLEFFRAMIADQVKMARQYSVNFRFAERYGLVEVKEKPIRFYFETVGCN